MERGAEQRDSQKRIAAIGRDRQERTTRLTGEDSYVLGGVRALEGNAEDLEV